MRFFVFLSIVFVHLSSTTVWAQSAAEIQFKKTQINCNYFSERQASNAELFGKKMQFILKSTQPKTDERMKLVDEYFRQGHEYIDAMKLSFRDARQSPDFDKVKIALDAILVAQSVVSIPAENPGRSAEWYQIRLFDDCVKK